MCYKQKCKVVSLNLAHPVVLQKTSVRTYTVRPSVCTSVGRRACIRASAQRHPHISSALTILG